MKKILFVEDDPDQILMYQSKFEMEGFLMMVAENEADALKLALTEEPDLILLDLLLRRENGLDILENLKKDERLMKIPVIIFTNYDKKEFREQASALGAVDFIIKAKVTPREIVVRVKQVVGE